MVTDLKTKLLEVAEAMAKGDNSHVPKGKTRSSQNGANGDSSNVRRHHHHHHRDGQKPRLAHIVTEDDAVQRLLGKSRGRGNARLRRRFLQRLAIALHSYGSSASRTEYLIEKAANRLDVELNISVFPSLILLSFPGSNLEDALHVLSIESSLDVDKLGRVDDLANQVGKTEFQETPLVIAYWRLKTIATSPPTFGRWWWRLFGYALSASMSCLLFFNGTFADGLVSFFLGFIVGIFDLISSRSSLFGSVLEFSGALVVSFAARLCSVYLVKLNLCFISMVLGSLVQLLPGLMLTLGVSEMVAKAQVTGTSRIMYALFSALQLGFGIAVGENLVFWDLSPVAMDCDTPGISIWFTPLCFAGFSIAANVLLNARLDQWPGMIVTSGVGYIVSTAANLRLEGSASSVVAAFAVGLTGTAYSKFRGDLPLVMVLSGILLLVPGGIGVKGVAAMMEDDVISGMGFVFNMLIVGLSITIGLLLAKIALPAALFGTGKTSTHDKVTLAAQLEDDEPSSSDSSEEDMAI